MLHWLSRVLALFNAFSSLHRRTPIQSPISHKITRLFASFSNLNQERSQRFHLHFAKPQASALVVCVSQPPNTKRARKQENLPIKPNEMKQRTEMQQQQKKSHTNKRRRETLEAAAAQTAAVPFAEEAPEIAPGHGALLHKLRPRSSFSHQPTNRSLSQPTNQESILALSPNTHSLSLPSHKQQQQQDD